MSKKKEKPPLVAVEPIKTRNDLEHAVARMGELQRQKRELENHFNDQIQQLQEELGDRIKPIEEGILAISLGIKAYTDRNRKELFPTDKKTAELTTGSISYRDKPAAVKTRTSARLIEKILAENGMLEFYNKAVTKFNRVFLRMKLELNKDAILSDPITARKITKIEIEDEIERLYVKPATVEGTDMEVAV
ncbi:MAG: host-nuclease inhibitor Gam family protein [Spirochaetales bacterium]|nr:host-nuclease inhibitor Gam family protein [Spirochaetales bacterium]